MHSQISIEAPAAKEAEVTKSRSVLRRIGSGGLWLRLTGLRELLYQLGRTVETALHTQASEKLQRFRSGNAVHQR
jgi:hypothetical protein